MDDRKLDRLERALMAHGRARNVPVPVPLGFEAAIMRAVREKAARGQDFWELFSQVARRFAPVGALAATAACGYAQFMDKVFNQALLALSYHGGGAITLAGLMP